MTTIFQMNSDELASLLHFLRPNLNTKSSDLIRLRMLITEWLLLNGLSTMHKFEKDLIMADTQRDYCNDYKWKMPNKMDCNSCGKYRFGRSKRQNYTLYLILCTQWLSTPKEMFAI